MAVAFIPPVMPEPHRVLLLGSATDAWYAASDEARERQILPRFKELVDAWSTLGARPIATFDDDLFVVGNPGRPGWFLLFEVDRLDVVIGMLQLVRETRAGVRMDTYVRFEARIGRPFFLLEESSSR